MAGGWRCHPPAISLLSVSNEVAMCNRSLIKIREP
jgi:hypothetical protein